MVKRGGSGRARLGQPTIYVGCICGVGKNRCPGDFLERGQAANVVGVVMGDDDTVNFRGRETELLNIFQYLAGPSLEAGIDEGELVTDQQVYIGAPYSCAEDSANLDNVRGQLHLLFSPIFLYWSGMSAMALDEAGHAAQRFFDIG